MLAVPPSHPMTLLEVEEQHPNLGVDKDVARREAHPVPVVARKGNGSLVEDPDEARLTTLVRARRPAGAVGGGQEGHVPSLEESPIIGADRVPDQHTVDPVG
jgi:hypothetical protein